VLHSVWPGEDILLHHSPACLSQRSAGVRRRFLEGAVWGSVEDRSVGGQHVSSWFLGGSLWLAGDLRRLLALVLLRGAGGGASLWDHLRSSRCLVVAGVLWMRNGVKRCNDTWKWSQKYLKSLLIFSCEVCWMVAGVVATKMSVKISPASISRVRVKMIYYNLDQAFLFSLTMNYYNDGSVPVTK